MAIQHITHFSIYVKDQDECLNWYEEKLGFVVCDDNDKLVPGYRWLTISPAIDRSTQFVLMPATNGIETGRIGNNGMCVLASSDCQSDCEMFEVRGVNILQAPEALPWGVSAIISDLYGNPYNLVEFGLEKGQTR